MGWGCAGREVLGSRETLGGRGAATAGNGKRREEAACEHGPRGLLRSLGKEARGLASATMQAMPCSSSSTTGKVVNGESPCCSFPPFDTMILSFTSSVAALPSGVCDDLRFFVIVTLIGFSSRLNFRMLTSNSLQIIYFLKHYNVCCSRMSFSME